MPLGAPSLLSLCSIFSYKRYQVIFGALVISLCLSVAGVTAQAQSMSVSPTVSGNGSYTLFYTLPTISAPASASFKLWEKIGTGGWTVKTFLPKTSNSYSFSGKTPGTYTYRIGIEVCYPGYSNQVNCSISDSYAGPVTVTVATAPSLPGAISPTLYHLEQKIIVAWLASAGQVSRYELQNNGVTVYSGTALSHTLTGLGTGISQTLRVRACNSVDLCSGWRTASAVTLQNHFNVPAANTTSNYTVTYIAPSGTATLQEQVGAQGAWTTIHSGVGSQSVSRTKYNGTYNYRLYFCSLAGNCSYIGPKTTVVSGALPPAPAVTVVPNTTNNSFNISWSAVAGVTSYRLQRGSTVLQNTSSRSFEFASASPGAIYTFSVWACAGTVCSANPSTGNGLLVQVPASIQVAPNATNSSIVVSWPAVSGATRYELQQNDATVYTGTATNRTQVSLNPGSSYTYRVRACNGSTANQCSAWKSSPLTVMSYPAPSLPTDLSVVPNHESQSISVSWLASAGQVGRYELQRNGVNIYSGTALSFTLPNVSFGENQTLRIRACNNASLCSGWQTANPVVLVDLNNQTLAVSPTVTASGSYVLAYSLPVISAPASASFKLYEKIGASNWTQISFLQSSSTSYSFSGKAPGTYAYRIGIEVCHPGYSNQVNCSISDSYAGPVTVTVATAPPMPGAISPTLYHLEQKIIVAWLASGGQVSRYELQNNGVTVYSGTALSHALTGLGSGISQTLRVRACNVVDQCSAWRTASAVAIQDHFIVPATNITGNYTVDYNSPYSNTTLQEQEGAQGAWTTIRTGGGFQSVPRLKYNGTYNYRLQYCPTSGNCSYKGPKSTMVSGVQPPAPVITVVPDTTNNSFSISWSAVAGAANYRLQRGSTVLQDNGSQNFVFLSAAPGTTYTFSVWACAGAVCSANPGTGSGLLMQTPASLQVAPNVTDSSITISWSEVSGATSYELQQNNVTIYTGLAPSRKQPNLNPGNTYTYRVRACNGATANQCSQWKPSTPTVLPYPAPSVPTDLSVVPNHHSQSISASWSASAGQVARYELQRNGENIYSGTALTYTLANVSVGEVQTLRVRSCNNANLCSGWQTASPVVLVNLSNQTMVVSPTITADGNYVLAYSLPVISAPASASFKLYEKIGTGNWTQIGSLSMTSTSHSFSGKTPGTYTYRIGIEVCHPGYSHQVNCSISDNYAGPVTVTVVAIPAAPATLSVLPGQQPQSLDISWPASSGQVSFYELQRNGTTVYSGTERSYTMTEVAIGQSQAFRVRACVNADACSNWRLAQSITLHPILISPTTSTDGNYTLAFDLPDIPAPASATFALHQKIGNGDWSRVAFLEANASGYSFSNKAPGTYTYRISLEVCHPGPTSTVNCSTADQLAGPASVTVAPVISSSSSSAISSTSSNGSSSSIPPVAPPVGVTPEEPPIDSGSAHPVGSVKGTFRVSESGSATYLIPIAVPAGVAGVVPQLAVVYNSHSGAGILGQGVSVGGIGSITRCRQTLLQDGNVLPLQWDENDRFCMDGQRLMLVSGTYGAANSKYKTEVDSYVSITAVGGSLGNPAHFTVEAKDGSTSTYGGTVDSRLEAVESRLMWSLSRFEDSVGNRINYIYEGDRTDGHRIKRIDYAYANPDSDDNPAVRIDFEYEIRPDKTISYIGDGQSLRNTFRLKSIKSYNDDVIFRRYAFHYKEIYENEPGRLSKLSALEECMTESTASCYPKTQLEWPRQDRGFSFSHDISLPNAEKLKGYRFLDVNGNGRQDFVWIRSSGSTRYIEYASMNKRESNGMIQKSFSNGSQRITYTDVDNDYDMELILDVIDYNSDGRQDLVVCKPLHAATCDAWDLYLSVPDNAGDWVLSSSKIALPFTSTQNKFGDINSDGLLDAININANSVFVHSLQRDSNASNSSGTYYEFSDVDTFSLTGTPPGPSQESQPYEPTVARTLGYKEAALADVNGDGRMDIVMPVRFSKETCPYLNNASCDWQYIELYTYINTGTAFEYDESFHFSLSWQTPVAHPWPNLLREIRITPHDFNNDGFTDLAIRRTNDWMYILSTGVSYGGAGGALTASVSSNENGDIGLVDYNRDGYTDVIWHDKANEQLKLRRWDREAQQISTSDTVLRTSEPASSIFSFADIDGDGVVDMIEQKYGGGNNTKLGINIGDSWYGASTGQVSKITDGYGRETLISYGTLAGSLHYTSLEGVNTHTSSGTNYCEYGSSQSPCMPFYAFDVGSFYSQINQPFGADFEADNPAPVLEMAGPSSIVTQVETSAPTASDPVHLNKVSYYYHHARFQAGGRGYLGFEKLATVDERTGIRTETTYHQEWPLTGSPRSTVVTTAEGHKLSESTNTMIVEEDSDNPKVYRVNVDVTTESQYSLSDEGSAQGGLLQTTTVDNAHDEYGNLTASEQVVSGGGVTSTKTVTNTYSTDPWEKRMGRLLTTTTTTQLNSDPVITRTTGFEYYDHSEAWPGLLKKEIIEPGDNEQIVEYLYDTVGNQSQVSKTADAGSGTMQTRTSQVTYDASGRYVTTTTDGLGHITSEVIQRNDHGQPTEVVDVHGVSTHILYTLDGREYQRRSDAGPWTHTNRAFCGGEISCVTGATYRLEQLVSGGGKTTEYHDLLGRIIRTSTVLFDGRESHVDIEYDEAGRISRQSTPYVDGETPYWTVYEYDLLGRIKSVTEPSNGVTTNYYDGYLTTVTNAVAQTRIEEKNGLGQLVSVTDNLNGIVTYTYDALGNLTQATTTADGETVNVRICYDSLGRKIAMHDPDKGGFLGNASTDCASVASSLSQSVADRLDGWWFYKYNDFGELIEQSDTKKQTSTMEYDVLGRIITRTDRFADDSVDTYTRWTYDRYLGDATAQSHTLLNLTAVVTSYGAASDNCSGSNYCQTYTYDSFGRATDTVTWIPGQSAGYIASVVYDSIGRTYETHDVLEGLITPTSGTRTLYNEYGYAGEIIDLADSDVLQKTMSVNSRGQVTEEWRNNGGAGIVTYEYSPHTGLLLHQQAQAAGIFPIQDVSYDWDVIGNLRSRWNQSANVGYTARKDLQESFCYDGLNRLIKSHRGTVAGNCSLSANQQDMEYDGLGNITRKTGVGTYNYSGKGPHAVTSTTSDGNYSYDNNGNQTGGAGRSIAYSSYDQPVAITKGTTTTSFHYGSDRNRWKRTDTKGLTTTVTHYLGNVERIEVQGSGVVEWKRYIAGAVYTVKTSDAEQGYSVQQTDKSYLYNDHLGSLDVVVDHVGTVTHTASFDAWGQRRHGEDWDDAFESESLALANFIQPITQRGYTGHEMLDDVGLIHMNGRIFDPRLARFMQADPYIQAATHSQSYNRYSYTFNNPLNATDPSGYIAWGPILKGIAWIVGSYAAGDYGRRNNAPWLGQVASIAGCMYGYCAQAAFGSTYGATQNLGVSLIAGVSAGALSGMDPELIFLASGMLGGTSSVMMGGEYGHGFISAGLGSLAGMAGGGDPSISGLITSAVVGGTVSVMTGGKFGNGAGSAAFSYAMQWAADKYGPGGAPPDEGVRIGECAKTGKCSPENFSPEEKARIDKEIKALATDITGKSYTSMEDALVALHESGLVELANHYGLEFWANIDAKTNMIYKVGTGYSNRFAIGSTKLRSRGDIIWHTHPSKKGVHEGDYDSAVNYGAGWIFASGKNMDGYQNINFKDMSNISSLSPTAMRGMTTRAMLYDGNKWHYGTSSIR